MAGVRFVTLFTLLHLLFHGSKSSMAETPMHEMLNAMQLMMTGDEFDKDFYEELINCMDFIDPSIKPAQDGAWQGIIDYWDTRGTMDDPWGQTSNVFMEYNVTATEIRGMTIYEPCGYSSNVAFYYPVTEMCSRYVNGSSFSFQIESVQSLAKAFSHLAMGSSFVHGTHTSLGLQQDVSTLEVLIYQMYQATMETFDHSPILYDLDYTFREYTAFEMVQNLGNMYTILPVYEWRNYTEKLSIPNYLVTYSGILLSTLTLLVEPETIDAIIPIIADAFDMPEDILHFLEEYYIPEFRNVTADLNMNIIQRTRLLGNTAGTLMKLAYASLWQEQVFSEDSIFFSPEANRIGTELLAEVNQIASRYQSFDHFNQDFQNGTDIYPGDMHCNPVIPHPKWHLQSAIGLLDLTYLSDEVHKLLSTI